MKIIKKYKVFNVLLLLCILMQFASCERSDTKSIMNIRAKAEGFVSIKENESISLDELFEKCGAIHFSDLRLKKNVLQMTTGKDEQLIDSLIMFRPAFVYTGTATDSTNASPGLMKIQENRWFTFEMSSNAGTRAHLIIQKDGKDISDAIYIPIQSDGKFHRYCIDLFPLYSKLADSGAGHITVNMIGLIPSEKPNADIQIKSLGFGSTPIGDPMLNIAGVYTFPKYPQVGETFDINVELVNNGDKKSDETTIKFNPGKDTAAEDYKNLVFTVAPAKPGGTIIQKLQIKYDTPGEKVLTFNIPKTGEQSVKIMVFKPESDEEYVPLPEVAKTDYLLGVNYFPGWTEGTHRGWGRIVPFPENKPLLGWYDENSPEVNDWQIKWALEHGISFFSYCWYGYDGQKNPMGNYSLTAALHEGLLNSKYKDLFKFTINWCPYSPISALGDLNEDVFSYWMENYFKKPYYLKIDNKPVLFIMTNESFRTDMESTAKIKQALEKMREDAKKEGFDGMYILGHFWGWKPGGASLLKNEGFDAGWAYVNWTRYTDPGRPMRPTSSEYLADQKANIEVWETFNISYVPTVSNFWDSMPWYKEKFRNNGGGLMDLLRCRLTIKDYKDLLVWTKNFMDEHKDPKNPLNNMLLLDNWNEYGEGHFIAPSQGAGFSYLDAIREVFTEEDLKHKDITPAETGDGPYDKLYVKKIDDILFSYPALLVE